MMYSARCPLCGVRVSTTEPGCPLHGPVSRRGEPFGEPASLRADMPAFPGYRSVRWLGRGGFGAVFAAEREEDGQHVAIKVAHDGDPDAATRLLHEIEALSRFGPPFVPLVFGSGTLESHRPYFVMEYLEVPTLAARLAAHSGPISLGVAAPWMRALLAAVEATHEGGYVHSDLKPENILVGDDGRVTLIDFGVAVPLRADGPTAGAFAVGTAEYMSPEQCENHAPLDARVDIYAAGVLFYEMLAGRPPFWGASEAVRQSHLCHRPPLLSSLVAVPHSIEELVHRCLRKLPDERFESVTALRSALDASLATDEVQAFLRRGITNAPQVAPPSSRPALSSRRFLAALIFFESRVDVPTLGRNLRLLGAELASISGSRAVALYGPDTQENPARAALRAAGELIERNICTKARIDLAYVAVQTRPNGALRFVSPVFTHADRFPSRDDPAGPTLSTAAADVLSPNKGRSKTSDAPPRGNDLATPVADVIEQAPQDESALSIDGRDDILKTLLQGASVVTQGGPPCVVRVIAGDGFGKSRLSRALGRQLCAQTPNALHIHLRAKGGAGGAPDQVVAELLRAALDVPDSAPPDGGRGWLGDALSAFGHAAAWPAVALALGWLRPDAPELRALAAAPGALRCALAMATGTALRRLARNRPLLILLDDAHLAGEAALSALEVATLADANASIWICAFGRPAFEETHPSWGERAARNETHHLGPLDTKSAAALCRKLLWPAEDVPDAAVQRLVERAQAVPMLLVELVRGLKREGIVRRSAEGGAYFLATDEMDRLPDLPIVEWFAEREIHALSPALAAHARLCAVLGDELAIADVDSVLRRLDEAGEAADLPLDARTGTQRLLATGILVPSTGEVVRFRHPLVREAIARSAPEAIFCARIHRAALAHYQSIDPAHEEDAQLQKLAFHAERAGERAIAERAHLSLAERARARQLYLDAKIHYSRSIELAISPTHESYSGRGLMRCRLGRHRDGIADFVVARGKAREARDFAREAEILLDEAEALDWVAEYGTSEERVREAMELEEKDSSAVLSARVLLGAGRSLHRKSREVAAADLLTRAASQAEKLGDEGYETLVIALVMLGFILQGLDRLDQAGDCLDRAIALCEGRGDVLHLGPAVANRALLRALLGDKPGMVDDFNRVLAISRELGQAPLELVAEFNLGEYLYLMDDLQAAELHVARAIALDRRQSGGDGRAAIGLLAARLSLYRGDRAAAAELARRIRERQVEALAEGNGDGFMAPSDDVLCAMIELATENGSSAAWDDLVARSAHFSVGQEQIEVLEARGLHAFAQGHIEDACSWLGKALLAAARIPNVMIGRLRARLAEIQSTGMHLRGAAQTLDPRT